jgi:pimeloyl-ACP methyl ester carboxylesterase
MSVADGARATDASISVNGSKLELIARGSGRPILFLHPHIGLEPAAPVLAMLASGGRLIAPSHPGFGRSELPPAVTTVDDLAYFYLDAMDALDLEQTLVVGVSFGAWIAAAIAIKSTARMSRLVLANPVGIKVGDRETRDILDVFAMLESEFHDKAFVDPVAARRDYRAMSEDELRIVARNRESAARFAWSPYMHDPKLRTGCISSEFRPWCCGAPATGWSMRAMAAPSARRYRGRSSSGSKAPATSRTWSSRNSSPSGRSLSRL